MKKIYGKDIMWYRRHLINRDGAICKLCNSPINNLKEVTIDHIKPVSRGGQTVISNLQLAHEQCNEQKADSYGE